MSGLAVFPTCLTCSCLMAFILALSSTWNILTDISVLSSFYSSICRTPSFSVKPTLAILFQTAASMSPQIHCHPPLLCSSPSHVNPDVILYVLLQKKNLYSLEQTHFIKVRFCLCAVFLALEHSVPGT